MPLCSFAWLWTLVLLRAYVETIRRAVEWRQEHPRTANLILCAAFIWAGASMAHKVAGPVADPQADDAAPCQYYAASNAAADGSGTWEAPWTLDTVRTGANGTITAGDTVCFRGGTYTDANLTTTLSGGSQGSPVVFRNYPGEWPMLDLHASGAGATYHWVGGNSDETSHLLIFGFEIYHADWSDRLSTDAVDPQDPSDITAPLLYIRGDSIILAYNIIRDLYGCVYSQAFGADILAYGNIVYNCGWEGTDRGHGAGFYWQSPDSTKFKTAENNVVWGNMGRDMQLYTTGANLFNITVRGNSIFRAGIVTNGVSQNGSTVMDGGSRSDGLVWSENRQWTDTTAYSTFNVDWECGNTGDTITIQKNVFTGKFKVAGCGDGRIEFDNNLGYGEMGATFVELSNLPSVYTLYAWDDNIYELWDRGSSRPFDLIGGAGSTHFSATEGTPNWLAETGWDSSSTYSEVANPAAFRDTVIVERADSLWNLLGEDGRGIITVYNWSRADTVEVLPAMLTGAGYAANDSLDIRHAQDLDSTRVQLLNWNGTDTLRIEIVEVTPPDYVGGNQVSPLPTTGLIYHPFIIRKTGNWET